ncbi:hypothetical protein AGMMS4957_20410 [Bacteroidia bacterium]|nr:hypothetical protein AGMMS4957_20410 [Bacteroidia bacterium]
MTVADAIRQVKIRMQELTPFGEWLAKTNPAAGGDPIPVTNGLLVLRPTREEKPIEDYIREMLPDALMLLIGLVPDEYLESKTDSAAKASVVKKPQDGSGYITLPADYFRLKRFKMFGWERPVMTTIDENSPEYSLQSNEYLRGGVSRPVCAVRKYGGNVNRLEYYSLPKFFEEHVVEEFIYIPKPNISVLSTSFALDTRLELPLVYVCASLVYKVYEKQEQADVMMQTALAHIKTLTNN